MSHNGIELKERYAVPGVRGHVRTPALFTVGQAWLYRIELQERYAVPGVRGHVRTPYARLGCTELN